MSSFAAPPRQSPDYTTLRIDAAASMRIATSGRVTVITLDAPSLRGPITGPIADALIELAAPDGEGRVRQAVSFGMVRDMTSSSITPFLRVGERLDRLGGQLVLFSLPAEVDQLIRKSNLRKSLRVEPDLDSALAAMDPRRLGGLLRRKAG